MDPLVPLPYRVTKFHQDAPDVVTFDLMPVGTAVHPPVPGQFMMLYVFGIGEVPISISGVPVGGSPLVHTVRAVGKVSTGLTKLREGACVGVRGPYGTAWPVEAAEGSDVLLIAGGLGLAPLRPAIRRVLALRSRYNRVAVLYGTRSPRELLYRDELAGWRGMLDVQIEITVDRADRTWHGAVGVVTDLVTRASFDSQRTIAMVCGPEVMMRFTVRALQLAEVPIEHIYLSMERSMKCAIGLCGRCQLGPGFVCKQGAVMRYDRIASTLTVREL